MDRVTCHHPRAARYLTWSYPEPRDYYGTGNADCREGVVCAQACRKCGRYRTEGRRWRMAPPDSFVARQVTA